MYDYNTTRSPLMLREYGRNIQKLMDQFESIDDKNSRTQKAQAIIKLMEVVNPHAESIQKRWDDLFILSDYKLDIDAPYAKPSRRESIRQSYMNMPLMHPIRYKYYGRNMELLVEKIASISSISEREQMLMGVVKLMRRFSSTWNNDYISNERIIEDIKRMLPSNIVLDLGIIRTMADDDANAQKARSRPRLMTTASKKREQKNNL
ncbi:DUF4290 domain-containing protein [Cardinium endosymbiont of Culicoides punctatus]|uniref:DUF4290 domain-containing protein n=1 Tax=Cardinium endosymbiont of Culicoides punctatus TaxID=2304601 RepID=UPI001058D673|nr:DUF4290 domain-containing protein [Cardinium endosymbiont of Culicoides punctatus]TDG94799.1 hypothetical protein CCPUN_07240 [Cardinium endosymbiont of Culicoides punctatus]